MEFLSFSFAGFGALVFAGWWLLPAKARPWLLEKHGEKQIWGVLIDTEYLNAALQPGANPLLLAEVS